MTQDPRPPLPSAARTVFFVSDGTGITAETIGHSLLTQFAGIDFQKDRLPFVDSPDKARLAAETIRQAGERQVEGARLALQHNLGLGGACVVTLYQAA